MTMLVAFDVDGTLDADPPFFRFLIAAVHKAGGQTAILTGCPNKPVTPADLEHKRQRLAELGIEDYGQLVVFPRKGIAKAKAAWCKQHDVACLIDNRRKNAKAASKVTFVLVPQSTKTK